MKLYVSGTYGPNFVFYLINLAWVIKMNNDPLKNEFIAMFVFAPSKALSIQLTW